MKRATLRDSASKFGSGVSRRSFAPAAPASGRAGSASCFGGVVALASRGGEAGSLGAGGGGALAGAAFGRRAIRGAAAGSSALSGAGFTAGDTSRSFVAARSSGRSRVRLVGRSGVFLGMRFPARRARVVSPVSDIIRR